jgi:hypothetical protein
MLPQRHRVCFGEFGADHWSNYLWHPAGAFPIATGVTIGFAHGKSSLTIGPLGGITLVE